MLARNAVCYMYMLGSIRWSCLKIRISLNLIDHFAFPEASVSDIGWLSTTEFADKQFLTFVHSSQTLQCHYGKLTL